MDEAKKPRRRVFTNLIVAFATGLLLYVLSTGPVTWLVNHGYFSHKVAEAFYMPLVWFVVRFPQIGSWIEWYADLW